MTILDPGMIDETTGSNTNRTSALVYPEKCTHGASRPDVCGHCKLDGATMAERARIVAALRAEADEHAAVVETMIQSEYHLKLRVSSRRWAEIAAHAHVASEALDFAKRIEGEGVVANTAPPLRPLADETPET